MELKDIKGFMESDLNLFSKQLNDNSYNFKDLKIQLNIYLAMLKSNLNEIIDRLENIEQKLDKK